MAIPSCPQECRRNVFFFVVSLILSYNFVVHYSKLFTIQLDPDVDNERVLNVLPVIQNMERGNYHSQNVSESSSQMTPSQDRQIIFVHIGKAGGETIKDSLKFGCEIRSKRKQEKCLQNLSPNRLSDHVHGYMHGQFKQTPYGYVKNATSFLVNIRHPVDRLVSWYGYVNPYFCDEKRRSNPTCTAAKYMQEDGKKMNFVQQFYRECFPTITKFALGAAALHNDDRYGENALSIECKLLASSIFKGTYAYHGGATNLVDHATANYRFYASHTIDKYPHNEVFVIRTEHLWDDMKSVERHLGGIDDAFGSQDGNKFSHGSESYKSKLEIDSPRLVQALCCVLQDEFIHYKNFLYRAVNLDKATKDDTWKNDMEKCGFSSSEEMEYECSAKSTE